MDHGISKRDLLVGGGLAVAAAATPLSACMAQSDRRMGYAIVGLGYYATRQIMPQFANCAHSKLVALVSGTPDKLERYGAEYGIPATHRYSYADYDRIADNPDIDIVYVVLPNSMHCEYSVRASKAGKHVLCEKPMAVSSAECERMIAAARSAGKKLMIGYRSRFEPHNIHAIDLAQKGFVGPTKMIRSAHGFHASPDQWRLDRALSGGGSMMDIGIYSLQAARYLAGEEPVAVTAQEYTDKADPRFATVEDRIVFSLVFQSGIVADCVSSYSSNHNDYRVIGTGGWIDMEPATGYGGHTMRINKDGRTETVTPPRADMNQFAGQLDHLSRCAMTGEEPLVPGEEGLKDLRIIEAIYRSMREGRTVRLDQA